MREIFWDAFPAYLVYGMSPEQYWKGAPELVVAYREAYSMKNDELNTLAWLQGLYVRDAMNAVISTAFATKKRDIVEYPDRPHRLRPLTEDEREEEAKRATESAIEQLNAMKAAWDKKNV